MRIETAIVTPARPASVTLSRPTGTPLTRAPSSSIATATNARYSTATSARPTAPRIATRTRSPAVAVRIDPNRYWKRFTFSEPASETSTTPPAIPV